MKKSYKKDWGFNYDKKNSKFNSHLHRRLTVDIGHPKLREHISNVITFMKVSSTLNQFKRNLNRALPKFGDTLKIPFSESDED